MTKFEAGKTYKTATGSDLNTFYKVEIISRTEKTVKAKTMYGVKTFRPKIRNGVEMFYFLGNYSMSPSIEATEIA